MFDLQKILVSFIIKVLILIKHMQQIDHSIIIDPLINVPYDAQQVKKFFHNQKILHVMFMLMIMNMVHMGI